MNFFKIFFLGFSDFSDFLNFSFLNCWILLDFLALMNKHNRGNLKFLSQRKWNSEKKLVYTLGLWWIHWNAKQCILYVYFHQSSCFLMSRKVKVVQFNMIWQFCARYRLFSVYIPIKRWVGGLHMSFKRITRTVLHDLKNSFQVSCSISNVVPFFIDFSFFWWCERITV